MKCFLGHPVYELSSKVHALFWRTWWSRKFIKTIVTQVDPGSRQGRIKHLKPLRCMTLQWHCFLKLQGHFLKLRRTLLCLLQNVWWALAPVLHSPFLWLWLWKMNKISGERTIATNRMMRNKHNEAYQICRISLFHCLLARLANKFSLEKILSGKSVSELLAKAVLH